MFFSARSPSLSAGLRGGGASESDRYRPCGRTEPSLWTRSLMTKASRTFPAVMGTMRGHVALLALFAQRATACTTVMVRTASDDCLVVGRTMELSIPKVRSELEQIYLHSRGTPVGTVHGKLNASRYGYLAVQFNIGKSTLRMATTEGINEAGLTVSAQIHEGASYEGNASTKSITMFDIQATAFLLACCKTVDEAAEALASVHVVATPGIGVLGALHWSVQDATGRSRVFEYIDESLRLYDNSEVGVLTNDPSYEWHLAHLNFFSDYPATPHTPQFHPTVHSSGRFSTASVPVGGDGTQVTTTTVPVYSGHGLNTRGLPASYSPVDRFVKMFLLKETAVRQDPPTTLDDGIVLVTGLLNTVHIVRGTVTGGPALLPLPLETTNWACVKVPSAPGGTANNEVNGNGSNGRAALFFYRTYDNMQWKKIDLGKVNFAAGTTHAPIALYEPGLGIKDVTPTRSSASPAVGSQQ